MTRKKSPLETRGLTQKGEVIMERRRMMTEGKKFVIEYNLDSSETVNYIRLNGEGEKLCGSGKTEVRKGDFLLIYAYTDAFSEGGAYIERGGDIAAFGGISATYEFYPESDAKIYNLAKIQTGVVGTRIVIRE